MMVHDLKLTVFPVERCSGITSVVLDGLVGDAI